MTKPVTDGVLAASGMALAVVITRVGPPLRAAVASAARSAAPASDLSPRDEGLALVCRPGSSGVGAFPHDDDTDSGDGGESDDGGSDDDTDEGELS